MDHDAANRAVRRAGHSTPNATPDARRLNWLVERYYAYGKLSKFLANDAGRASQFEGNIGQAGTLQPSRRFKQHHRLFAISKRATGRMPGGLLGD
jgi:hypothetical protein